MGSGGFGSTVLSEGVGADVADYNDASYYEDDYGYYAEHSQPEQQHQHGTRG
jgi:hypothetical protein